jgi:hypothetical protein
MAGKKPVPTVAIIKEISKALGKLKKMRPSASVEKQKAIDLEMKVLAHCKKVAQDILPC